MTHFITFPQKVYPCLMLFGLSSPYAIKTQFPIQKVYDLETALNWPTPFRGSFMIRLPCTYCVQIV